jgi:type I restriction enzyme R subunit
MEAARWNGMDQIYREFPLRAGRVVVRGQKSFRDTTTVVPISALPLKSA